MRKFLVVFLILVVAAVTLAACGGGDESESASGSEAVAEAGTPTPEFVGDPEAGEQVFMGTCVACHGPDAKGMEGLGKSLHPSDSEFIRSKTDKELVEFIKKGRTPDDPLNTTGVGMPAKGGNPAITEQQLYDVVAWIRTLE